MSIQQIKDANSGFNHNDDVCLDWTLSETLQPATC